MIDIDASTLEQLRAAKRIVFFSGAGISAESGVPTFRDDLTGLWAQYDPMELATLEAFNRQPDLVWGWYEWRRQRVRSAQPNDAHIALAQWQELLGPERLLCITQNVDDLHERAGCQQVLHLHGNLFASFCAQCHLPYAADDSHPDHSIEQIAEAGQLIMPPQCSSCQGLIRPGVVWFGESLDSQILQESFEHSADCDVFIAIGTSGVVQPAATLPNIAAESGAYVMQINPQETPIDMVAQCNIRASAAQALPILFEQLSGDAAYGL